MNNSYRTNTCGDLSNGNIGESVKLSGWVDTKRDHGGVLFIDLRDNYGKIQIVADEGRCKISNLDELAKVHNESVICVDGKVVERSDETKNPKIRSLKRKRLPQPKTSRENSTESERWRPMIPRLLGKRQRKSGVSPRITRRAGFRSLSKR